MRNATKQPTSVVCRKKTSTLKYAVQIVVVVLLLFAGVCPAQSLFLLAVGGSYEDESRSVALTSDGGYIVTGVTNGFGAGRYDLFLAKFNSSGELTWIKTVGEIVREAGNSVALTSDSGYIVTGYTSSFGAGSRDLFLVKFSSSGDLTWAKTVGGARWEEGNSVVPTPDGGYIVTGYTTSFGTGWWYLFLAKFNSSGDLTWAKTVGGADDDWGNSVALTSDGGYIVTGITRNFGAGNYDLFLCKFDSIGNLTWAKTVGGTRWDEGRSIASTFDGGYIVTGRTESFGAGDFDLFLAKFNSFGDLTWAKTVGGADDDWGNSIALTPDGGCIVTGWTFSFGAGDFDLFLVKFSSSGDLTWVKTVGGAGRDCGYSVAPISNRRYIVNGGTESFGVGSHDLFLGKFSSSGEIGDCSFVVDCSPVVGSPSLSSVSASPTIIDPSLTAVSCSPTVTSISPVVTEVCSDILETLTKPTSFELTVSPNPFNSSCAIMICQQSRLHRDCATVKIEIYDLHGRLVWNKLSDSDNVGATSIIKGGKLEEVPINKGDVAKRQGISSSAQGVIIWQPSESISSGVYLVRATTDDGQQITKRIVYLK